MLRPNVQFGLETMLSAATFSFLKGQSQRQPNESASLLPPLMLTHAPNKCKSVCREPRNINCQNNFEEQDEAILTPLLPPIPTHFSTAAAWFYRILSGILSTLFLIFVILLGALIKSIPSMCWTLWSWFQLKDPNRLRPFYEEEKKRKHIETGKLICDIGYYARRVGLECDDMKIETEDGFILTMHHIVDRRPGAVHYKRTFFSEFLLTE